MAQKDLIIKERGGHSGLFDFSGFYSHAHNWLKEEGYGVVEDKYSEKLSGNTRDISIEWKATKKFSDYFKVEFAIRFDIKGMSDVEVEIDGTKKKMNKGGVDVEIKGFLIRDPKSEWDSRPFLQFLRDAYNKYIVPSRIKGMEDKVEDDVIEFKEVLKAYWELYGRRK